MRHVKGIAAIVVVVLGVLAGVAVRAEEPDPIGTLALPSTGSGPGFGVGEELILVIADEASTAQTAFNEVQGFVPAAADDYRVTGMQVQTSADLVGIDCPRAGAMLTKTIDGVLQQLECPLRGGMLRLFRPVSLSFVARDDFPSYVFPSRCDGVGRPPCQRERFREVLTPDGSFRSGTRLLVTAFRTRTGAEEFIDLARTLGVEGLVTVTARKLGGGDVGLGQEAHPDGSGPLTHALPDQTSYQR